MIVLGRRETHPVCFTSLFVFSFYLRSFPFFRVPLCFSRRRVCRQLSGDDIVLSCFTFVSGVWCFSFFLFLYTQSAEYGAEEIGSRRCPDAVREWGSCWCICYLVGGGSSLAEIHGTQDEPRVGITFWEQFVTPFSMPEEGYDTVLA